MENIFTTNNNILLEIISLNIKSGKYYLRTTGKYFVEKIFLHYFDYFQKSLQFNLNLEAPLIKYIPIKSKQGN